MKSNLSRWFKVDEAGCSVYDTSPILGIGEYTSKGSVYTREFTADGYCILHDAEGKMRWKAKYEMVSPTTTLVSKSKGGLLHALQADGSLKIEGGKYSARKK